MWVLFHFSCIPVGGSVVASMFPPISWKCIIWHLRQNLDSSFSPWFFSYHSVQMRKIAIVQPRHNHTKKNKLGIREQKESYMSSHRGGLKMKEKEMREGITVLKMKKKQWWSEYLLIFCEDKGSSPPMERAFLHTRLSAPEDLQLPLK